MSVSAWQLWPAEALDTPPTKKLKMSPFHWFQGAPDRTDVQSASAEPLNVRVMTKLRIHEQALKLLAKMHWLFGQFSKFHLKIVGGTPVPNVMYVSMPILYHI